MRTLQNLKKASPKSYFFTIIKSISSILLCFSFGDCCDNVHMSVSHVHDLLATISKKEISLQDQVFIENLQEMLSRYYIHSDE